MGAVTISDIVVDVLRSAGRPMKASEVIQRVRSVTDTSDSTVRNELAALLKREVLEQPKYGHYQVASRDNDQLPGSAGLPSGAERSGSDEGPEYPYLIGGPGAGQAGGLQYDEGKRVRFPRDVVANWTGGSVPAENEAYWTRVRGTSMEPWLPQETPIFVVRCDGVEDGARYVVYLDDDDAELVKRIERLGGGVLLLISDNPAHPARKLRRLPEPEGDEDMYHDLTNDLNVRMRVRGKIVYPADTPQAILRTFAQQMAEVVRIRS